MRSRFPVSGGHNSTRNRVGWSHDRPDSAFRLPVSLCSLRASSTSRPGKRKAESHVAGCADPAGLPKLAETQVWGGSFDALAGLRFPEAVGERFQAWRFPEAPLAEGHFPDCPELGRHVPTFRLPVGRLPLSQFRPLFLVRSIRSTAHFPVEAQKWRFRWWIRKVVSTWTEEDAHFPGATFRLDMRQSSWNSRVTFRAPLSGARVTTKIGKCSRKWLAFRHATFRPKNYKRGWRKEDSTRFPAAIFRPEYSTRHECFPWANSFYYFYSRHTTTTEVRSDEHWARPFRLTVLLTPAACPAVGLTTVHRSSSFKISYGRALGVGKALGRNLVSS